MSLPLEWGCPPIKGERELGLDRRETVGTGAGARYLSKVLELGWKAITEIDDYIAGIVLGDGRIDAPDSYGHYRLRIFDSSQEFLKALAERIFQQYYKVKPSIHWDGTCWYLSIYGKEFVETIKLVISKEYYSIDYVRGLFDSEGSIYIGVRKNNKKYLHVSITNKKHKLLFIAQTILNSYGIKTTIVKKTYFDKRTNKYYSNYRLIIRRKADIASFIKYIGIRHPKHLKYIDLIYEYYKYT